MTPTLTTEPLLKNETLSEQEVIKLRDIFVSRYCEMNNQDKYNLSFEQILEIREHKEQKSPGMLKS